MVGLRVKDIDFDRRRIRVSENAVEVEVDGIIEVGTPKVAQASHRPVPAPPGPGFAPLVEARDLTSSSSRTSAACTCAALG